MKALNLARSEGLKARGIYSLANLPLGKHKSDAFHIP